MEVPVYWMLKLVVVVACHKSLRLILKLQMWNSLKRKCLAQRIKARDFRTWLGQPIFNFIPHVLCCKVSSNTTGRGCDPTPWQVCPRLVGLNLRFAGDTGILPVPRIQE